MKNTGALLQTFVCALLYWRARSVLPEAVSHGRGGAVGISITDRHHEDSVETSSPRERLFRREANDKEVKADAEFDTGLPLRSASDARQYKQNESDTQVNEDFAPDLEEMPAKVSGSFSSEFVQRAKLGFVNRRRSVHEVGGCNSDASIGGSELFLSCNHPQMTKARWPYCKCLKGFQQGADGYNGKYQALVQRHGICVPCGCFSLFEKFGFTLKLCPREYPNRWISGAQSIKDNLILPSFNAVKRGITLLKEEVAAKYANLKALMSSLLAHATQAVQAFTGSTGSALLETEHEERRNELRENSTSWTNIIGIIRKAINSLTNMISKATRAALEAAKNAYEAAKAFALRLKATSAALSAALPAKIAALTSLVAGKIKELSTPVKEVLVSIGTFVAERWKALKDVVSGVLSVENFNVQLMLTNPTAFKGELTQLVADVDYQPDTQGGGGIHGTTKSFDLVKVKVKTTIKVDPFGSTAIDLVPLVGAVVKGLDFSAADILKHGIMGFLEDAATGKLKVKIRVDNLDLKLFGMEAGWTTDLLNAITAQFKLTHVTLPIDLDAGFVARASDAVNAFNYLFENTATRINQGQETEVNTTLGVDEHAVRARGTNKAEALSKVVQDAAQAVVDASAEEGSCSAKLAQALRDADKEANGGKTGHLLETDKTFVHSPDVNEALKLLGTESQQVRLDAVSSFSQVVANAGAQVDTMKASTLQAVQAAR